MSKDNAWVINNLIAVKEILLLLVMLFTSFTAI